MSPPSDARLRGLLRDAGRALYAGGATQPEALDALRDAVNAVAASCNTPSVRASLDAALTAAPIDAGNVPEIDEPHRFPDVTL